MKRLITTAALAASLAATSAFAQSYHYSPDEGPYLGAGIGHSKLDNDTLDWLGDNGVNTDDSDTGYKLFVGYQFNPNFAIEAGYVNFGEFTANAAAGRDNANLELGIDGFTGALIGKLPIQNGFSVFGKLGMVVWDADLSGSATVSGQSFREKGSEDGTDPFYGIGAEYEINQIMIRTEYERYDLSKSGEDFEIDLFSASLGYRF